MHRRSTLHQIFQCRVCDQFCYSEEGLEEHIVHKHGDYEQYKKEAEFAEIKNEIRAFKSPMELNKYVGTLPRKMGWSYGSLRQIYTKIEDHIKERYKGSLNDLKDEIIQTIEKINSSKK